MPLEVGRDSLQRIALDQLELLQVRNRVERIFKREQPLEIFLVALAHGERTVHGSAELAVLGAHAAKAGEGIEADDLAVSIKGLEDAAQRRQQRKRLAPAHAELHDHAVRVDDLAVNLVEEKRARERLRGEEDAEVRQQLVRGQRRGAEMLVERGEKLLLALARQDY